MSTAIVIVILQYWWRWW